jgi:hypothetical protein
MAKTYFIVEIKFIHNIRPSYLNSNVSGYAYGPKKTAHRFATQADAQDAINLLATYSFASPVIRQITK